MLILIINIPHFFIGDNLNFVGILFFSMRKGHKKEEKHAFPLMPLCGFYLTENS